LDPPVNERGLLQIEELIERLRSESSEAGSIDVIYTSDLARAVTTADAVGRLFGLSPIKVVELREIGFGEWEGLSWTEIEARDPVYARRWSEAYPELPARDGEIFEAFQARVLSQVKPLLASASHRCAAVVTHAGVMRVVLRSLCGMGEQEAWERTDAYCTIFRYEPERLL
jgi:broad specificity phosphatase PhoE